MEHSEEEQGYIRTDIPKDTLASLEMLDFSLGHGDVAWLKWSVVAAHMAAYSATVGYLTGTSGIGALTKKSTAEMLGWHENFEGDPPDERLADFPELIKRVANGDRGFGDPLDDIGHLLGDLQRLNGLRNRFNHFRDAGWMIEIAYLRPLLTSAVQLVAEIDHHSWAFRHAEPETKVKMRALLHSLPGSIARRC